MMLKPKFARPLDQTEKEWTNIDTMVTDDKRVTIHWTGLLDWITGLDYWTRPKWCKMPFQAFFSVGEKLIMFIQPASLLNLLP